MVFGTIGIILSLILLMYLAYRGISVLIIAPILACFAAIMSGIDSGSIHILATYTETFMSSLAGYVRNYFPIFLLGAIFGKVMDHTGSAKSISYFICDKFGKEKAILAIVLACAVLTYGGVSLFVVSFAIYPVAAALFRESRIPKRFIPGAIACGAFTFTMTGLPGSPQIQNAIPMQYFGTDAYAAPVLGIIGSIIMGTSGIMWLQRRAKKAMAKGEGYGVHQNEPTINNENLQNIPPFGIAILPIILVLVVGLVTSKLIFPKLDFSYLESYGTTAGKVLGNWSLIIALVVSIVVAIIVNFKRMDNVIKTLTEGVSGSFLAVMNTASEVGYGNVIASMAAFAVVKGALLGLSSNPLVSEAVSVSALAGITGSASGGLSIALEALADTYLKDALAANIDPQVLHRIASMACGGLDTMPHNGAVITVLAVTGMTHRESYGDIAVCTAIIPVITVAICIVLASFGVV
ncbi:GntP family permease [Brachyspira pilosicoli]|uniref:GntP family permease n=1 Tax=Brachyspira pilosicoli TaxID=52584 RepID=A0A5C8F0C2_BRAPL|nr:GntP family permease [Brachyspira pilosicoli]TXJ43233.1 GntP family permease [Brachyspira pilosicoli]